MSIALPNRLFALGVGEVSMACCDHVVPDRTKTKTEPASAPPGVSSRGAETSTVFPEMAVHRPNASTGAGFGWISVACNDHVVPERTNTWADPSSPLSRGAPTTRVSPSRLTERPKLSISEGEGWVSVAWSDAPVWERTPTYAAPVQDPAALSSRGAPTTPVFPSRVTS
jgi:hypothetical protein